LKPDLKALKTILDQKADQYNNPAFIEEDPIQVPHRFHRKEDIEIAGFLTAVIAWGNRTSIINNALKMMALMGNSPCDFILHHRPQHLEKMEGFVHRTFNATDLITFIEALGRLYREQNGLEGVFNDHQTADSMQPAIHLLKKTFFSIPHLTRTRKHLPDPLAGSAAKRINMYLRWMVRKDQAGVDFGIWKKIPPAVLSCPLDIHSGTVARSLGLLHRKQNDAKAVAELDARLRILDPEDPVRYDFALFGMGMYEH